MNQSMGTWQRTKEQLTLLLLCLLYTYCLIMEIFSQMVQMKGCTYQENTMICNFLFI